ncbi:pentapeptide repeat-containing protein [Pseudaestuariivita rosea]|uniref:pentapeptide repeat-containing protein n=1 Tax=Pseudaestuariivita rosea TaxID=2763263 RepID=UPI001ABAF7BF|nr:pentapeptide repeat-containing protein [Pseudaestuariivita rosea]
MPDLMLDHSMYHFRLIAALLVMTQSATADPTAQMRPLGNCAGCVISSEDFSEYRLMGLDLTDADISDVSFSQAFMSIAVLNGARLEGVSFEGADLRGATFVNAQLSNVSFIGADLTGAIFEGAVLTNSDLTLARLCKTQMPNDDMANADCG